MIHAMTQTENKRKRDRAYYYAHREERLAYQRKWYAQNKEKVRSYKNNPAPISTMRAIKKMEECVQTLVAASRHLKSEDARAALRYAVEGIEIAIGLCITTHSG